MGEPGLGDFLPALHAISELAFGNPFERRVDRRPLDLAAALLRQRHCLDLHRINTGEAANTVLIERDWRTIRL